MSQKGFMKPESMKIKNVFFKKIGFTPCRIATMRHGVTRKRSTQRLKHTVNLFRNNLQLKDVC